MFSGMKYAEDVEVMVQEKLRRRFNKSGDLQVNAESEPRESNAGRTLPYRAVDNHEREIGTRQHQSRADGRGRKCSWAGALSQIGSPFYYK